MILHFCCHIKLPSPSSLSCTLSFHEFCHPYGYLGSLHTCHVFSLDCWQNNCGLSFVILRNGSTSHHEYKPYDGSPILKVIDLIRITISDQILGANPLKHNLNCKAPCKYIKKRLAIIQWSKLGLAMCWLTMLIEYDKSNQVHNMHTSKITPLFDKEFSPFHHPC